MPFPVVLSLYGSSSANGLIGSGEICRRGREIFTAFHNNLILFNEKQHFGENEGRGRGNRFAGVSCKTVAPLRIERCSKEQRRRSTMRNLELQKQKFHMNQRKWKRAALRGTEVNGMKFGKQGFSTRG